MKRKTEEELIALAFGELDSHEASEMRKQIESDPQAQMAAQEFAGLKESLHQLKAVPDHQLSTERLREAILRRGLKERRSANWFTGWGWAPAAVACLAFGIMMLQHKTPQIPGGGIQINPPEANAIPDFHGMSAKVMPPVVKATTGARATLVASRKPRHRAEADYLAYIPEQVSAPEPVVTEPPHGPVADNAPTTVETSPGPAADQVVLIDNQADNQTGASKATETSTLSHVPISG